MPPDELSPIQRVVAASRPVIDMMCERCQTVQPHARVNGRWVCLKVVDQSRRLICSQLPQEKTKP
jgi:hypothetical protein